MGVQMTSLGVLDLCGMSQGRDVVHVEGQIAGMHGLYAHKSVFFHIDIYTMHYRAPGFPCEGGLFAEEAVALLRTFYESGNPLGR